MLLSTGGVFFFFTFLLLSSLLGKPGMTFDLCPLTLSLSVCARVQLSLAKVCSSDNPLGLEQRACADLVAQLFRSCPPVPRRRAEEVLRQGINDTMR